MILTGPEIRRQVGLNRLRIEPFRESQLSPNSYDFLLGEDICWYAAETLDCRRENLAVFGKIPPEGMVLSPDKIYLGCTAERMGSDFYVPIIRARSSVARLGLFVHVTADLIDIGSFNQWTLQLHAVQPVRVYPNMRIGQVTFWRTHGEIVLYAGKYQHATGPRPSEIHRDMPRDLRSELCEDPE